MADQRKKPTEKRKDSAVRLGHRRIFFAVKTILDSNAWLVAARQDGDEDEGA